MAAMNGIEQGQAIHTVHLQVGNDQMRIMHGELGEGLRTIIGRHNLIASGSQADREQPEQSRIIIDKQDSIFGRIHRLIHSFYVPLLSFCSLSIRLFSISLILSIVSWSLLTFLLSSCNLLSR